MKIVISFENNFISKHFLKMKNLKKFEFFFENFWKFLKIWKISKIFENFENFENWKKLKFARSPCTDPPGFADVQNLRKKSAKISAIFSENFEIRERWFDSNAVQRSALCKSRLEPSNEHLFAKVGFDTAENEPCEVCPLSAYRSPRLLVTLMQRASRSMSSRITAVWFPICWGIRCRSRPTGPRERSSGPWSHCTYGRFCRRSDWPRKITNSGGSSRQHW